MPYLKWNEKFITDFSDTNINSLYNEGYLFTRVGRGEMRQTRSIRVNVDKFKLSSENKRVLKKNQEIVLEVHPIPYPEYTWQIHKLGKEFYEQKFGPGVFSANKVKEMMTDPEKNNFNRVLVYSLTLPPSQPPPPAGSRFAAGGGTQGGLPCDGSREPFGTHRGQTSPRKGDVVPSGTLRPNLSLERRGSEPIGYCIARETDELLHYCYPFYNIQYPISNIGMSMMTKAVVWAKEQGKKYIYLGSAQRPTDTYKMQFEGIEWFDGKRWQSDIKLLKNMLS